MDKNPTKASRGRPKTLNRDHILDVAMYAYWREGIDNLSLNEICRRCEVSKPGLYREFGNDDGLMKAVLVAYEEKVLTPILKMLITDEPFLETLDKLVSFVTRLNDDQEIPDGCLMVDMRNSRMHMGEATREQIDHTHEQILIAYEKWVDRSKAKGEFSANISSQLAATYIYTQLSNALLQVARGEGSDNAKKILTVAFSMLQ